MNVKQMRKRASHAASLKRSERLQRLLRALSADYYKTTSILQAQTGSMAIHSDIHELRCEGVPVAPAKYFGKNSNGKKIHGYKLMEKV